MPISLEHIAGDRATARNFETLARLVPDTGGRSVGIRFGANSATWTAAIRSATVAVSHGLGRTPVYANAESNNSDLSFAVTGKTSSVINVIGYYLPGANLTGSFTFDWVAIG